MSDRHQELLRQHKLLREHLAWIDREIAREAASTPVSASSVTAPTAGIPSRATTSDEVADTLLKDYAAAERHDPAATKRGCLLAFAAGLGLLIAAFTAVYFLFYAPH